jgi:hypothetical protein
MPSFIATYLLSNKQHLQDEKCRDYQHAPEIIRYLNNAIEILKYQQQVAK